MTWFYGWWGWCIFLRQCNAHNILRGLDSLSNVSFTTSENKDVIYVLPHELPKDVALGNYKKLGKSQNIIELLPSAPPQNENSTSTSKQAPKIRNWTQPHSGPPHKKTRAPSKYPAQDCGQRTRKVHTTDTNAFTRASYTNIACVSWNTNK